MPSHPHKNTPPRFFFDAALYCQEEHWDCVAEEEEKEDELETAHISSTNSPNYYLIVDNTHLGCKTDPNPLQEILGQDLEDEELRFLLNKEQRNEFCAGIEGNPGLIEARAVTVERMLKIVGYYSFSALTAILAVDYFDRFLRSCFKSHFQKPWMAQLVAVACLSLAAKVEEIQVPLLLDLQVESQYVFASKTIQRMELLVLSTLKWKMNPVTPLSFIEYIARGLDLESHFCGKFLRRSQSLLLFVISDYIFAKYLPSALATATMLCVLRSLEPCICVEYQDKLAGILGINKKKVAECCKLIQEAVTATSRKRKLWTIPGSPKGTLDVCFSFNSDSSNESWAVSSTTASVSSSPQPLSKKLKSLSPKDANI